MTTNEARLARLETQITALSQQVAEARSELLERIDGGPRVEWEHSLRGRLHTLESEAIAAGAAGRALAEAQRERRLATEERNASKRDRLKLWAQAGGVVVAAFAVALPYVLHIVG